jgi:hypothetical protein
MNRRRRQQRAKNLIRADSTAVPFGVLMPQAALQKEMRERSVENMAPASYPRRLFPYVLRDRNFV